MAVRAPSAPLFRAVIERIGEPLVAPSANRFQQISPTCAAHVAQGMGDGVAYVLDGGPCALGLESTIVSLISEAHPILLRQGPITQEALEDFLGLPIQIHQAVEAGKHLAPGLYKRHYSPKTPLYVVRDLASCRIPADLEVVFTERAAHVFLFPPKRALESHEFVLSPKGDLNEAAAALFACLQRLDRQNWRSIWIEWAPDEGIGRAINDRLSRAAFRVMGIENKEDGNESPV